MTSNFGTPDIELKENSTRPVISDTILDENGNALDLSGATVKFLLERPDGQLAVNSAATITDAANGEVEYTLSTGETAATGRHLGEWRVEFSASNIRRHPVGSYLAIDIDRALGDLDAETVEDPDLTVTTLTADTVLADQVGTENNPIEDIHTEDVALSGGRSTTGTEGYSVGSDYIIRGAGDGDIDRYWYVGDDVSDADAGDRLEQAVSGLSDDYNHLYIPPGVYGGTGSDGCNLVIDTGTAPTLHTVGWQSVYIKGGTTGHAIELLTGNAASPGNSGYRTHLKYMHVETTPGAGNNYDGVHIAGDNANVHLDVYINRSDRHGVYVDQGVSGVMGQVRTTTVASDIDGSAVLQDSGQNTLHVFARNQDVEQGPNSDSNSMLVVWTENTNLLKGGSGVFYVPFKMSYINKNGDMKIGPGVSGNVDVPNGIRFGDDADINSNRIIFPSEITAIQTKSSDINPPDETGAVWISDGTDSSTAGDLMYSYTDSGGTTTVYTLDKTAV